MKTEPRTTTEIFKDKDGNYMTRVWYPDTTRGSVTQKMKIIPTDPSQIRKSTKPVEKSNLIDKIFNE